MNRSIRTIVAVAVFVAVAAITFGVSAFVTRPADVVVSPQIVDFGNVVHEQQLNAEFMVYNNGEVVLTLDQFVTSCGCISVAIKTEEGHAPVDDRVSIASGDFATFVTGMTAGTMKGSTSGTVMFRSSCPELPHGIFEMRASLFGRLHAIPNSVNMGRVLAGERKQLKFVLTDGGLQKPFEFSSIDCTDTAVSVSARQIAAPSVGEVGGTPLYEVIVDFSGTQLGPIRSEVRVFSNDSPNDDPVLTVPLNGEVVSGWSLSPPAVVFPQRGRLDPYSVAVYLKNHLGQRVPLHLSPESVPDWLKVHYSKTDTSAPEIILSVPPEARTGALNTQLTIRPGLETEAADAALVKLPVFLTVEGEPQP